MDNPVLWVVVGVVGVLLLLLRRRQTRFPRPWRASPAVDLPPLGWRDPASGVADSSAR
jgi:hypothetical protein